jgi:hypothetical protein
VELAGQYAEEVRERWGHTQAYAESSRRTASYSSQDWARIRAAAAALEERLGAASLAGLPARSGEAMDLAEEHRQAICDSYYACDHELHRGLGELYVDDERFKEHYDAVAPGLAQWLRAAINANADRWEQRK